MRQNAQGSSLTLGPMKVPVPLDYEGPSAEKPTPQRTPREDTMRVAAWVLAIAFYFAGAFAGVAADRTYIPLPKKIVITALAMIVLTLLILTSLPRRFGCATVFALFAALQVFVMWFWN
jgi:hypothetical protein